MRPITASDLMNSEVLTVRDDLTVRDLAAFLVENEITGAPVEDRKGRLVGVVSVVDIAEVASRSTGFGTAHPSFLRRGREGTLSEEEIEGLDLGDRELRVRDIMTPGVFGVDEEATVAEVAMKMLRDHLHRLLVLRDGKPVGIISTSDLLGLLVDVE